VKTYLLLDDAEGPQPELSANCRLAAMSRSNGARPKTAADKVLNLLAHLQTILFAVLGIGALCWAAQVTHGAPAAMDGEVEFDDPVIVPMGDSLLPAPPHVKPPPPQRPPPQQTRPQGAPAPNSPRNVTAT